MDEKEPVKISQLPATEFFNPGDVIVINRNGKTYRTTFEALVAGVLANIGNTGGGDTSFDSDRPILRVPQVGDVIGGDTLSDFASFYYFVSPTIAISLAPTTTLYEWGTVNTITINVAVSNPGATTLSNGVVQANGASVASFQNSVVFSHPFTFSPGAASGNNLASYILRALQDFTGPESGTAQSPNRTVRGVYPILFGVSPVDLHAGGNAYTELNKDVSDEGDTTQLINGTGFIYFAFPTTWGITNLSGIFDANGFNVTTSFAVQTVSVASSGNDNDWVQDYRVYKLQTETTVNNAQYQFNV